ncbi:MAG: bifunctional diaminohydroxyphosphoribosylaminopyrimidine deaminase/5-amino-6-(5-phosphoribosylamino)uracil reductase RibD [Candidatus Fermentibacteraceae bacterium]
MNRRAAELAAMKRAVALARDGWPGVFPNPMVGAVILDPQGNTLSEAHHQCCGGPHAEASAIGKAFGALEGSTLVVTLEPCVHHGRTPPCAEAIVASRIKRVVAAMEDPDPRVSGRGAAYLREHGVEVEIGLLEDEARDLNRVWIHCLHSHRSFLHLKMAVSLDGRAAASDGSSRWITGAAARERVREMRGAAHGVMVGAGTALRDNPSLTTGLRGPLPVRIIVAATPLPPELTVYSDGGRTITAVQDGCPWDPPGEAVRFNSLENLLSSTLSMGIGLVLCEGGPRLATALVNEGLVDRLSVFTAPKLLGGNGLPVFHELWVTDIGSALTLEDARVEALDGDVLVEGRLVYRAD